MAAQIVARGPAYGIPACQVDGNDVWAVYEAVAAARKLAVERNTPVLIEAITYRMGHHSTSDDSSCYWQQNEIDFWRESDNPIQRMQLYLKINAFLKTPVANWVEKMSSENF